MKILNALRPFANVGLHKVGRLDALESRAAEKRILQPAETEIVRPAIFLPGQLDLALKVIGGGDLNRSLNYLSGTTVSHGPVVEYVLRDAFVHAGGVDLWGARLYTSRPRLERQNFMYHEEFDQASYCMDAVSRERFGHWLTDACPTSLLAGNENLPIIDVRPDWPHAVAYADALGIKEVQGPFMVKRLSVYDDLGQGSSKRRRYKELRRRLAVSTSGAGTDGADHVYLRRGTTGDKRLINHEDALMHRLEQRGFRIVDVTDRSLSEIFVELRNASIIFSLDGSHITHIYYIAPENAVLVTLIPDDRFVDVHKNYCDCVGMGYGFIVCRRSGEGYEVDLNDVDRTLDLVARSRG